jgi:hypothetical protein
MKKKSYFVNHPLKRNYNSKGLMFLFVSFFSFSIIFFFKDFLSFCWCLVAKDESLYMMDKSELQIKSRLRVDQEIYRTRLFSLLNFHVYNTRFFLSRGIQKAINWLRRWTKWFIAGYREWTIFLLLRIFTLRNRRKWVAQSFINQLRGIFFYWAKYRESV